MADRSGGPALKEPCRCRAFCIEDTARTGRFCQIETNRLADAAFTERAKEQG